MICAICNNPRQRRLITALKGAVVLEPSCYFKRIRMFQIIYELILLYPSNPWWEWCDVWRLATIPGTTSPALFEQRCGFFYVPQEPDKCKCCETGPTVFRPYPRRLESLTVCRCHHTGSTFSPVIQRPWVLVSPRFEPVTSRLADRRSPNWANQEAVSAITDSAQCKSDTVINTNN